MGSIKNASNAGVHERPHSAVKWENSLLLFYLQTTQSTCGIKASMVRNNSNKCVGIVRKRKKKSKLIFATALVSSVVPRALVLSAAAALAVVLRPLAGRRLFRLRQELIQTKRILLVLLELHRTAARRRTPIRPAEFLVRNKSGTKYKFN
jgi:hypothetical protein